MKVNSEMRNGKLYFDHFLVRQESDYMYSIYQRWPMSDDRFGKVVSSSESFNGAAKKAKLMEIGYQIAMENIRHE